MNIVEHIAQFVASEGRATTAQLREALPYSNEQIKTGLLRAQAKGLVKRAGRLRRVGQHGGSASIWVLGSHYVEPEPVEPDPTPARGELARYARVSSVWEIGRSA